MGIFSKLKSNITGGVQVHLQAPSTVAANQAVPVTITITSDASQTINKVKAEIKAQGREQGFTLGNGQGVGMQEQQTMAQTIAQVENREPFTIGPGETKTVNLQLYLSNGPWNGTSLGQPGNVSGALGNALQAMATVAQNFEHINYLYTVHASADVQDHHIDPSDKQPIQILPPGATAPGVQPTPFNSTMPNQSQPPNAPQMPTQPPTSAPPSTQIPQVGPPTELQS